MHSARQVNKPRAWLRQTGSGRQDKQNCYCTAQYCVFGQTNWRTTEGCLVRLPEPHHANGLH